MDQKHPGDFNEAMMDFGSLVCKPASPDCKTCPLNADCFAFKQNLQDTLPAKSPKRAIKTRYFHYFLIESDNAIYLKQRNDNDIWKKLYDLPLIETKSAQKPSTGTLTQFFGAPLKDN